MQDERIADEQRYLSPRTLEKTEFPARKGILTSQRAHPTNVVGGSRLKPNVRTQVRAWACTLAAVGSSIVEAFRLGHVVAHDPGGPRPHSPRPRHAKLLTAPPQVRIATLALRG